MQAGLSILPLALVLVLLATRRVTLASAGLVALATTLPAVIYLRGADGLAGFLWIESLKGAWVSWQGLSVIFAGRGAASGAAPPARQGSAKRYRTSTSIAAPSRPPSCSASFVETAVGFGVGTIVAVVGLVRLGLSGPAAAALSVFSQVLVPWGAMAVGIGIGAGLLGVEVEALGTRSAEVAAMTLPFLMPFFWGLLRNAGVTLRPAEHRHRYPADPGDGRAADRGKPLSGGRAGRAAGAGRPGRRGDGARGCCEAGLYSGDWSAISGPICCWRARCWRRGWFPACPACCIPCWTCAPSRACPPFPFSITPVSG